MPITSKILDGIIFTELSGEIGYDLVIRYIDFIFSLKDKMTYRFELHDHTDTKSLKLNIEEIRKIASYSTKVNNIFSYSFLAIYAPNDLTFGIARMFESFYKIEGREIIAKIFKDKEDAVLFLKDKIIDYEYQ